MRAAAAQRLAFLPLLAVVFFNVSGGPYGVEDAVSVFGPGLTLLLLALTPLAYRKDVAGLDVCGGGASRDHLADICKRCRRPISLIANRKPTVTHSLAPAERRQVPEG